MGRRIDTPGEVSDPQIRPRDEGPGPGPLLVEIPLGRLGRIKFESYSQKASLALAAMALLIVLVAVLAAVEAFPGEHPGVAALMDRVGQAMMLVLGVLLGVDWKGSREDRDPP